jgi:large subunit ribosomal protein L13
MDGGDYVVVINAEKVRLSGRKGEQKTYFRHTGYMGHGRHTPVASMLASHPDRVIEKAVFGMLPKSTLGRQVLRRKLRVYAGPDHPHQGQQPLPLKLTKDAE